MLPLFARVARRTDAAAILSEDRTTTYGELALQARSVAESLLAGVRDLDGARVAVLATPGPDFVAGLWGTWLAGGVAVPLGLTATADELDRSLEDSGASCVIADEALAATAEAACRRRGDVRLVRTLVPSQHASARSFPDVPPDRPALMLFTSGTTNRPKGVVITHACLQAWIDSLVSAWQWTDADRIPLFLPLHHVHGLVNVLCCGLWSGATIDVLGRFDAEMVHGRVAADAYTLFMAVPTIYVKLIEHMRSLPEGERRRIGACFGRLRLMVSGSAALPASVFAEWESLTGQRLLERYGMTEIGMALGNPYRGERRPGTVGQPMPGVEIRLIADAGLESGLGEPGEIQVRGPNVFREYWRQPTATADSFVDGWFRTGDLAVVEDGYYRILGRTSIDILKSGGYKLSALEIESVLLDHPGVAECAVVGIPDETWGEAVAAAIVPRAGTTIDPDELCRFCRARLSPYKVPRRWLTVASLPRNHMGKVLKPAVTRMFPAAADTPGR